MSDAPDDLVLETFQLAAHGKATADDCRAAIDLVLEDHSRQWHGYYQTRRSVLMEIRDSPDLVEAKLRELRIHFGIIRNAERE